MSIRVEKYQKQEKWPQGHPSWDHGQQLRKNQQKNAPEERDSSQEHEQPLTTYDSRGQLVVMAAPTKNTI